MLRYMILFYVNSWSGLRSKLLNEVNIADVRLLRKPRNWRSTEAEFTNDEASYGSPAGGVRCEERSNLKLRMEGNCLPASVFGLEIERLACEVLMSPLD